MFDKTDAIKTVSKLRGALLVFVAVAASACVAAPDERPPGVDAIDTGAADSASLSSDDSAGVVCEHGEVRDCKVNLPSQNGVENCFVGAQLCVEGAWSPCGEEAEVVDAQGKLLSGTLGWEDVFGDHYLEQEPSDAP